MMLYKDYIFDTVIKGCQPFNHLHSHNQVNKILEMNWNILSEYNNFSDSYNRTFLDNFQILSSLNMIVMSTSSQFEQSFNLAKTSQQRGTLPQDMMYLALHLVLNVALRWHCVISSMKHLRNYHVINICFMYNTLSIETFWLLLHRKKWHSLPLVDLTHHHIGANCRFASEPSHYDCANGEKADVTFTQSQKFQNLYCFIGCILVST